MLSSEQGLEAFPVDKGGGRGVLEMAADVVEEGGDVGAESVPGQFVIAPDGVLVGVSAGEDGGPGGSGDGGLLLDGADWTAGEAVQVEGAEVEESAEVGSSLLRRQLCERQFKTVGACSVWREAPVAVIFFRRQDRSNRVQGGGRVAGRPFEGAEQ